MYLRRNETNFRVLSKTTAQGSVPCVKKDRPAQLKREWSLAASLSPSQRELSQHLKYIVRDRISEFESSLTPARQCGLAALVGRAAGYQASGSSIQCVHEPTSRGGSTKP